MKTLPLKYAEKTADASDRFLDYARSPTNRNRLACILNMVAAYRPPDPAIQILDIGCGIGNIAAPLASRSYSVLGIDVHAPSVELAAKTHVMPHLAFKVAKVQSMDLSQFDVIILTEVLEHVKDWRGMLNYLATGMKPDALLILTVPNGVSPQEIVCRPSYMLKKTKRGTRVVHAIKWLLRTKDLTTADQQTPHVNFYRLKTLHAAFEDNQLTIKSFCSIFFVWSLWEVLFSRLISERWAQWDFRLAQHVPPSWRTMWCFALEKEPAR